MTTQDSFDSVARHQLGERAASGARWFYWIAALSLFTSIVSLLGSGWGFLISLGVTQLVDAVAKVAAADVGWGTKVAALLFDMGAAGAFAVIGLFASRRHAWAFTAGMALYALDAAVCGLVGLWLGLAFHAYALFNIYGGYKAAASLADLERATPPPAPEPAV